MLEAMFGIIIGMNRSVAFSSVDTDRTVEEYRAMAAKLFGFADVDTFAEYTDALARLLLDNENNANVDEIANRLIYDGAVLTVNGYYVLPYAIEGRLSGKTVLAFVLVDTNGVMAIWLNDAEIAFEVVYGPSLSDEYREVVFINGRCTLFEAAKYTGFLDVHKGHYVAVEKVKTFQSAGNFLIYSPFSDEEGFEVYWFSVYGYDLEVIYGDADSEATGTVQKGFYTLINVASSNDVRDANQRLIDNAEQGGEEDE